MKRGVERSEGEGRYTRNTGEKRRSEMRREERKTGNEGEGVVDERGGGRGREREGESRSVT